MDTMPKKEPAETKLLRDLSILQWAKTERVQKMETLVDTFDTQGLLKLNHDLREYYESIGDSRMLKLLDQMTGIMDELTEIINQVKAKRISLEQGQKELQEKLSEINEVLQTMQEWEMTGI